MTNRKDLDQLIKSALFCLNIAIGRLRDIEEDHDIKSEATISVLKEALAKMVAIMKEENKK